MDNPYQPPKADGIGGEIDKPGFFKALRQASQKPAIAWGFWERGRILHGIVLSLVVAFMVVAVRPEAAVIFRERIGDFLGLILVANFLYSIAYLFELVALLLPSRRVNPTLRFVMLVAGTFFAVFLTILAVEFQLLAVDD
jgi:hypothetical protein